MGYQVCMTDVQAVGAGLTVSIQPPVNQSWRVTLIGSDQWVGVAPNAVPDVTAAIFDGTLAANVLRSTDTRGWYRRQNLHIDNTNYLRLTNDNVAGANLSWSAELTQYYGTGTSVVKSDVQTVGAAATVDIQPPTTEDWLVTDVGSSTWVGAAPAGVPNMEVDLFDGTNAARILSSVNTRQWEAALKLYISNADYLRLTNSAGAPAQLGWSAELLKYAGAGNSNVRSDVQVAGAGATVDFQPPNGEEWEISMIGASVWAGIAPNQFPNITASIFDGTNASTIQTAGNWMLNGHDLVIHVSNTNYLRVLDAGGAGGNIGISAHLTQRYA